MQPFVVYDKTTGRILRQGYCPRENLDQQAKPGEGALAGAGSVTGHIVDLETLSIIPRRASTVRVETQPSAGVGSVFVVAAPPGARVEVVPPTKPAFVETAGGDGRVMIETTEAGVWHVKASHPGYFDGDVLVDVPAPAQARPSV